MLRAGAWRDRTLSYRSVLFAILALGVVRLIAVLMMPPQASVFAPDEAGYAGLVEAVAAGEDWATYSYGYGASIWPQARALLIPATWLASWGVPAYGATRVVAVGYSVAAALLMLGLYRLAVSHGRFSRRVEGVRVFSWPALGLATFLLMPSHALWNSLALREAATEFWVLGAVASAAVLFAVPMNWWQRGLMGGAIALSVAMAFQSRGYMAVALVIALAAGVAWWGRERPRFSLSLAGAVVVGALFGLGLSSPPPPQPPPAAGEVSGSDSGEVSPDSGAGESSGPGDVGQIEEGQEDATGSGSGGGTGSADGGQGFEPLDALAAGVARAPSAVNPDTYLERGSLQRELSAQFANSAIAVDSCAGVPDPRAVRWCEITRLPGAAFAVLFRPLWPLDAPTEWSALAVAAGVENLAWLALVVAALGVLVTRRSNLLRVQWIAIVYGSLLVAGMAALEGNFGTAFRHKSNVLWVLCLVLVLAGPRKWRRDVDRAETGAPSTSILEGDVSTPSNSRPHSGDGASAETQVPMEAGVPSTAPKAS